MGDPLDSTNSFVFSELNPYSAIRPLVEDGRIQDIRDARWAHPDLREGWFDEKNAASTCNYLPETPIETKREFSDGLDATFEGMFESGALVHTCDIERVTVPGSPEEPETQVEILVYRPKNLNPENNRVLFYCLGGGLVVTTPGLFQIDRMCDTFRCIAIVTRYRRSWEAPYPAAINDLHAAYAWMVENADALKVDPDNVVLTGNSSGSQLALAVAFRLKRYGYSPKGIVAVVPQTDERSGNGSVIYNGSWDSATQRTALTTWLGDNANSGFIGPEALANHATVEDCKGYPPCFIHTVELDPDRDFNREFYGKLLQARSYAEYHSWGGASHDSVAIWADSTYVGGEPTDYAKRVGSIIYGNIEDCFKYDLRRPWVISS